MSLFIGERDLMGPNLCQANASHIRQHRKRVRHLHPFQPESPGQAAMKPGGGGAMCGHCQHTCHLGADVVKSLGAAGVGFLSWGVLETQKSVTYARGSPESAGQQAGLSDPSGH